MQSVFPAHVRSAFTSKAVPCFLPGDLDARRSRPNAATVPRRFEAPPTTAAAPRCTSWKRAAVPPILPLDAGPRRHPARAGDGPPICGFSAAGCQHLGVRSRHMLLTCPRLCESATPPQHEEEHHDVDDDVKDDGEALWARTTRRYSTWGRTDAAAQPRSRVGSTKLETCYVHSVFSVPALVYATKYLRRQRAPDYITKTVQVFRAYLCTHILSFRRITFRRKHVRNMAGQNWE